MLVQSFKTVTELFSVLLNPVFLTSLVIIILVYVKKIKDYKDGIYYQVTKVPYFSVRRDLGKWGEYLIYKYLKNFENQGAKFLFNAYIPKENGKTTEIDVLMISKKGIFVFESKNYSGWIFGNEKQKNWYQTLPAGRGKSHKECFYNPIMQNRSHIKHLKAFLGEQVPMYSIIVFSERCTLKKVEVKSTDISVINRNEVVSAVSKVCANISEDLLSESEVVQFYNKLYPYTQSSENEKKQHIVNIQNNLSEKSNLAVAESDSAQKKETDEISLGDINVNETIESDTKEPQIYRCPKCGGNLVLRTVNRGVNAGNQFWGCENFPKCRYIRNTTD